ncbi:MAG TPA: phytanoyl-CoA dioxygenase family protein [Candidatus Limnocylindrales bacterium]|nr:phytanoyl-CoA dioxygenase family protein [Candidatus Limnocylindrales bacterium]
MATQLLETSSSPLRLTEKQIAFYHEKGYLIIERVLDEERLIALREVTDRIVEGARGLTQHTEVYDLEDSHIPDEPRVRRIKNPSKVHPLYWELSRDKTILGIVAQLIGPNIRFHSEKLNMKSAGYGAPVEWHQDWAFYPHTNDDVLAVGILLDDSTPDNGPLMVIPGSHRGPVYDHHANGRFCGAIHPSCKVNYEDAVPLLCSAGGMTIHHVRAVHGSAPNYSHKPRRLLLFAYAAVDAWPLMGMSQSGAKTYEEFNELIVAGEATNQPRLIPVPVRMPLPPALYGGSIYENQKGKISSYFQD